MTEVSKSHHANLFDLSPVIRFIILRKRLYKIVLEKKLQIFLFPSLGGMGANEHAICATKR